MPFHIKCIPSTVTIPATLAYRVATWPGGLREDWEGGESGIWCVGRRKNSVPVFLLLSTLSKLQPSVSQLFLGYFLYWISNARQLYFGGGEEKHFVSNKNIFRSNAWSKNKIFTVGGEKLLDHSCKKKLKAYRYCLVLYQESGKLIQIKRWTLSVLRPQLCGFLPKKRTLKTFACYNYRVESKKTDCTQARMVKAGGGRPSKPQRRRRRRGNKNMKKVGQPAAIVKRFETIARIQNNSKKGSLSNSFFALQIV